MHRKHRLQKGMNFDSIGKIVKHKRVYQKGFNYFPSNSFYIRHGGQYGKGWGSLLMGMGRFLIPLIKSGYDAIKKEAISAGSDILEDVVKNRGRAAVKNLTNKAVKKIDTMMEGSGHYKGKSIKRKQSVKLSHKPRAIKRSRINNRETKEKITLLRNTHRTQKSKRKNINFKEIFG